jgi:hypothetical protein
MVTDALRQALQVPRRAENAWIAAGLIHRVAFLRGNSQEPRLADEHLAR